MAVSQVQAFPPNRPQSNLSSARTPSLSISHTHTHTHSLHTLIKFALLCAWGAGTESDLSENLIKLLFTAPKSRSKLSHLICPPISPLLVDSRYKYNHHVCVFIPHTSLSLARVMQGSRSRATMIVIIFHDFFITHSPSWGAPCAEHCCATHLCTCAQVICVFFKSFFLLSNLHTVMCVACWWAVFCARKLVKMLRDHRHWTKT